MRKCTNYARSRIHYNPCGANRVPGAFASLAQMHVRKLPNALCINTHAQRICEDDAAPCTDILLLLLLRINGASPRVQRTLLLPYYTHAACDRGSVMQFPTLICVLHQAIGRVHVCVYVQKHNCTRISCTCKQHGNALA